MSSQTSAEDHLCPICCCPTSVWCARCRDTRYCSSEHLINARRNGHFRECKPNHTLSVDISRDIVAPSAATPKIIAVSALIFMPHDRKIDIAVVQYMADASMGGGVALTPLLQEWFTESVPEALVIMEGVGGVALRRPLQIWYCPKSVQRGAPVNRAIRHFTAEAATTAWCGAVVALKYSGTRRQAYVDATASDLPALSAYFLQYTSYDTPLEGTSS
ncbi:hypothetical protein C8T65DRAFT_712960 [Cerioporus squamosus]|nr:hypothetical protein C8T65DRAFT_712960 [Cerioporus squamosus]